MGDNNQTGLRRAAVTLSLLTVGAVYAASFFPEARLWGFNGYRYFGWIGPAILLILGVGGPLLLLFRPLRASAESLEASENSRFAFIAVLLIVVYGVLFVVLRSRTFFLGDGYQVLHKVFDPHALVKPWDLVTHAIHRLAFHLTGLPGEGGGLFGLQAVSVGCGILFLAVTAAASLYLFRSIRDRLLFTLGVGSGGYMLLCFGYIENYPPFALVILLFTLVGLLAVRGVVPGWLTVILLLIALFLHPFGVTLLPPTAYLLLRNSRLAARFKQASLNTRYGVTAGIVLLVCLALYFLYAGNYFFRFSLVPLAPDRFTVEGYWLLSGKHLVDLFNLLFLLLPGWLLFFTLTRRSRRESARRPEYHFLGWFLAAAFLAVLLFNPRLGMPRDWDLFSFIGIPLAALFFLAALDREHSPRRPPEIAWLAILLGFLVLGPRVVTQAIPEKGIEQFDYVAELDVAKSRNGRYLLQQYLARQGRYEEKKERALANGAALPHEHWLKQATAMAERGDYAAAVDKFKQSIRRDPLYPYAWSRLGVVYTLMGQYDSALTCLQIADGLNPMSFAIYMQTAAAYYGLRNYTNAEVYWRKALNLEPGDLEATGYLAGLYQRQHRPEAFARLLTRVAHSREVDRVGLSRQLVDFELKQNDINSAVFWLREGLKLGLDPSVARSYKDLYPLLESDSDGE